MMYNLKIIRNNEELLFENKEIVSINYSFKPIDSALGNNKTILNIDAVIDFITDPNSATIRKTSKSKFRKIVDWVLNREDNNVSKILIETILSEEDRMYIEFEEVNIYEVVQDFETTNPGRYKFKLRQNYFVNSKKIKIEEKGETYESYSK